MASAAHLTTVSATREEVDAVIRDYWDAGVRHIVALRGDPPEGIGGTYQATKDGYFNAAELAAGIRDIGTFEISVGCYPEKHPESRDFDFDIDLLKQKIDYGATRAITQFFFDADIYFRFLDKVRAAGIDIPIVPGIMLQQNFKGLMRMAGMCGASVPKKLGRLFEGLDDDPKTRELVTAHVAAQLVSALSDGGVDQFHLYTLNRADLALSTCALLGVKPRREAAIAKAAKKGHSL
jgi:methylenetetrahydrofolate reductase (NADPH)